MARRTISIDEKIEAAKAEVTSAKKKYDTAIEELEKLLTKKQELDNQSLIEAFTASSKSLSEVIAFLKSDPESN